MLTQQQALHRDFHGRAILSALHDKTTAWLGLGSSFSAIYRQFRLKTAAGPIALIFLYHAGIFSIHVTTPVLFSLVNITGTQQPQAQLERMYVAETGLVSPT